MIRQNLIFCACVLLTMGTIHAFGAGSAVAEQPPTLPTIVDTPGKKAPPKAEEPVVDEPTTGESKPKDETTPKKDSDESLTLPSVIGAPGDSEKSAEVKFTAGPSGFPLPTDAAGGDSAPGGGGKILLYEIPRERDVVAAEIKGFLATDGWTVTAEELSPRGTLRLDVEKDTVKINPRIAGADGQTAIILTLP